MVQKEQPSTAADRTVCPACKGECVLWEPIVPMFIPSPPQPIVINSPSPERRRQPWEGPWVGTPAPIQRPFEYLRVDPPGHGRIAR